MKTLRIIVSAILFLYMGNTFSQLPSEISSSKDISIESPILNETREITVSLPDNYNRTDNSYPVLYLLDGRTHLRHATSAADFLSVRGVVPNMIVVSVHNVDRNRDFSPVYDKSVPTSGGGEQFLGFMADELIPYMDENFRTSGFNILMGHSFGGTFAVYSLLARPSVFEGYIAVSPYLHYADSYLVKKADKELKPFDEEKYFYMTVGDEPSYFDPLSKFSSYMKEKTGNSVDFKYLVMKSENHGTIPYLSLFSGLKHIFSDWPLPPKEFQEGLSSIDAHYSRVSSKYGFKVQTPEPVINTLGYTYLQKNEINKAISVFKENVKRYPGSANVYDSLGEALENNSQFKQAEKNYRKAYELGLELNDVNTPVYKKNLERMQQK